MKQKEKYYLNQFFKFLKKTNKYNSFIKIMSNKGLNNINEYYNFILSYARRNDISESLLVDLLNNINMFCSWEFTDEGHYTWAKLNEQWLNYIPNIRDINIPKN